MSKSITYTSNLPPLITQYFNKHLLSVPTWRINDDSDMIWHIYEYIKSLTYKLLPNQLEKYKILEQNFKELYERTVAKEDELEAKNEMPTKFFYRLHTSTHQSDEKLLNSIRYAHHKKYSIK